MSIKFKNLFFTKKEGFLIGLLLIFRNCKKNYYLLTASFKAFPGLNAGAFEAGIFISSPV